MKRRTKVITAAAVSAAAVALSLVFTLPGRGQDNYSACKAAYAAQLGYYLEHGSAPSGSYTQPAPCQALTPAQRKQAASEVVFGGQR